MPLTGVSPKLQFDAVKVISATTFSDRQKLSDRVTDWLRDHPRVVEIVVTQSSDAAFHCLTFTLFYRDH